MKVGNKIKKIRELRNFTQDYMAGKLNMSISNYSKIERDEIPITLDRLEEISQVLKVKYNDILSFDEKNVFNFINSPNSNGYINHQYNMPKDLDTIFKEIFKRLDAIEKKI